MLVINSRKIGNNHSVYIIAELGINYNGKLSIALELVEKAAESGVDAVKLQIVYADGSYDKRSPSYEIFRRNELPIEQWKMVCERGSDLGLDIIATFGNHLDVKYNEELGLSAIKISSSNLTNVMMLASVAATRKPLVLSTGMGYLSEVDEAIRILEQDGPKSIAVLQCTSIYPTSPIDINLNVIKTLKQAFPKCTIGFSDHSMGIACAIASIACGARVIEKHFTLGRKMEGPDHYFSATPEELKALVNAAREVELALGSSMKCPTPGELVFRSQVQRTLVSAIEIKKGEKIQAEKLTSKRTQTDGIQPKFLKIICGRVARRDIRSDTPIFWNDV